MALVVPVDLREQLRLIPWSFPDHEAAEAAIQREIGSDRPAVRWHSHGLALWHEPGRDAAFNSRASWFTHVAEDPIALAGTCVITQSCCLHGLTQTWIDIVCHGIKTMPAPVVVAAQLLGRKS